MIKRKRDTPFIQQDWVQGVESFQHLGAKRRAVGSNKNGTIFRAQPSQHDQSHDRPSKRRRTLEQPMPKLCCDTIYPFKPQRSMRRQLRINVVKIFHRATLLVKGNGIFNGRIAPPDEEEVATWKARCGIRITCGETEGPVYYIRTPCELQTHKNPVGPGSMARIALNPRVIREEQLHIHRDGLPDWADSYALRVELESDGGGDWPPLGWQSLVEDVDVAKETRVPPHEWTLSAEIPNLYEGRRARIPLSLEFDSDRRVPTNFVVEVDIRWSMPFSQEAIKKRQELKWGPSITAVDFDEVATNGTGRQESIDKSKTTPTRPSGTSLHRQHSGLSTKVNGFSSKANALVQDDIDYLESDADDEDVGGDVTPSRSRRANTKNKVYNLKKLSDKAHGKKPRQRRMMGKGHVFEEQPKGVVWILPDEKFREPSFRCCIPFCWAKNPSWEVLRLHLRNHTPKGYQVHLLEKIDGFVHLQISHRPEVRYRGPPSKPRTFQLGRAKGALDLKAFNDGDESWVTDRYGPDNESDYDDYRFEERLKDNDEHKDAGHKERILDAEQQEKYPVSKSGTHGLKIPQTKYPLFDPLSKVLLQPGAEYRRPVADNSWLIHKHREVVHDYSDVSTTEKEYIKEWDSFMIGRHISSDVYVPRAVVAFAREKATWLITETSRAEEFGKHMAVLLAKDILDEDSMNEALDHISEARVAQKNADWVATSALKPKSPTYRSKGGCVVCQLPVLGPSLLLCTNEVCCVAQISE